MQESAYFNELAALVQEGEFEPLTVELLEREVVAGSEHYRFDARFSIGWGTRRAELLAEHKTDNSPRVVRSALDQLAQRLNEPQRGLLLVDYLTEAVRRELRERRMSGMDLCGNYMIQTPEFLALRLDQPNRFPSRHIQNIYGGQSALVSRLALVTAPLPATLAEWSAMLEARGGRLAISTISKVLSGLREDAMISADRATPRLLRPLKLLERLASSYQAPAAGATLKLKLPTDEAQRDALLRERLGEDFMWSGDTSASRYGAGMPPTVAQLYTSQPLRRADWSDLASDRFYNCVLSEVRDPAVYFDRRGAWASPVQSYLELMSGDARARELAQSVADFIVRQIEVDRRSSGGLA